jgi:hypothetical protein
MIFFLKMMICILDFEVQPIRFFAFKANMSDPSILFFLLLCDGQQAISANWMPTEKGKEWVLLPQRILAILNEALPKYL